MSLPLEHFALRLRAPASDDDDATLSGEIEAIYSGECRAFRGDTGLLAALQALRLSAATGGTTSAAGPAGAGQRRSSKSP